MAIVFSISKSESRWQNQWASPAEIKEVIDVWYRKEMSRAAKLKVLDLKIIQINEKIKELQAMKKHIEVCKVNISGGQE